MSLFKPAQNKAAYLKAAFMGLAGSGKTFTAVDVAIGMVRYMDAKGMAQAKKPVYFVDSEGGSSWFVPRFKDEGIDLQVANTSAFADLAEAMNVARQEASVLIIDSITAFWVEWCDTYKEQKNRRRGLEFQDWAYLKSEWKKRFTNRFLNDPVHTIMCGRMGFEYEHYVDDAGKKQIEKTGVKMKAESEMGFEPSLLVQMEADQDLEKHGIINVAHVLKDRRPDNKSLNGKTLKFPTFASFLPHIEYLNMGGEQQAFNEQSTSAGLIPDDPARENYGTMKEIVLEEIEAVLVKHYPSTSKEDKQTKAALILRHFGTVSWTEISKLFKLERLQACYDSLHRELENAPSRYQQHAPAPVETVDEIPFLELAKETVAEPVQETVSKAGNSSDEAPVELSIPAAEIAVAARQRLSQLHNSSRISAQWKAFQQTYGRLSADYRAKADEAHQEARARVKEIDALAGKLVANQGAAKEAVR
jgi:hypothetical protein